jgi:hypothetical protein
MVGLVLGVKVHNKAHDFYVSKTSMNRIFFLLLLHPHRSPLPPSELVSALSNGPCWMLVIRIPPVVSFEKRSLTFTALSCIQYAVLTGQFLHRGRHV